MKLLKSVLTLSAALAFTALIGCASNPPMQPQAQASAEIAGSAAELSKKAAGAYPQYGENTFRYRQRYKGYEGGNIRIHNGSTFHLKEASLTPPAGTPDQEPVTITMHIDRDKFRSELVFTFGPHGAQFDPPAEVWLDWKDLHANDVKLYYIEDDGTYTEQQPDDIDLQGKRLKILIDHFSKYAIGGI